MITSLQNEQVKHIAALHSNKGRKEYREYLIEGKRFVQEGLRRNAKVSKIYYFMPEQEKRTQGDDPLAIPSLIKQAVNMAIPVEEVSEAVMKKISSTESPQGILAIVDKPQADWQDILNGQSTILLIVDNIQDPGNLGTILRTALAADVRKIILTKGTVDVFNPKVLRSSMGAIFDQIILTDKTPEQIVNFCQENKFSLAVSTMEGTSIFQPEAHPVYPLALVIGNEAFGPADYFLEKAEKKVAIPMANNVESLNAAMAAGIFLYELRRRLQFL